jgi:putative ABC transport system ATP-binding protein
MEGIEHQMEIHIKSLRKHFTSKTGTQTEVLRDVSLSVSQGEFLAIQGRSGAGKTTLLNIIGCLDTQTEGCYQLDGQDVQLLSKSERAKLRCRRFGFIMQDFALINDDTVIDNIVLPAIFAKTPTGVAKTRATELLEQFGLHHLHSKKVFTLSGGEKQRVAIIRALMNDPDCILADEPTGALDTNNALEIMKLFVRLHNLGKTIIIVTHDDSVAGMSDRIVKISDGKIE